MTNAMDTLLVLLTLSDLLLLGSSRLNGCIRLVAIQGVILGLFTIMAHPGSASGWILAVASMALKAVLIPKLLVRAMRETQTSREVEPFIGFNLSMLIGVLALGLSLLLSRRLPLPYPVMSDLVVPVGLFTLLAGLFLIMSRKKAITQILGYLVMENGIFVLGVGLVKDSPLVVELGVLLDLLVAVFVMGLMVFHINRQFQDINADQLSRLQDWHT